MNARTVRTTLLTVGGLIVTALAPQSMAQVVNPANGHVYYVSDSFVTAPAGEEWAQSLGGHLVTINDHAEQVWLLAAFPTAHYIIGFTDDRAYGASEGNWLWMNGEAVTYTNWAFGEPNNKNGVENFGQIRPTGKWNDIAGTDIDYAIAEIGVGLLLVEPAIDLELQQGQQITIAWQDDGQFGAQINLFFDPDLGDTPWNEGKVNNEIAIPISIDASDPANELIWYVSNLDPGFYSIWGKSNNGVHEPAYSRAPGLVLVTEFTEDTEPEVDEDRIDLFFLPDPTFVYTSNNPTNLYLVIHGWNGPCNNADHLWIEETANDVAAHIFSGPNSNDWDVAFYNWEELAHGIFPFASVMNAEIIGSVLGQNIKQIGYSHVEIIAHSAGSWMAHKIAKQLGNGEPDEINVQLTLLDAFVPPWMPDPGSFADHTSNFYDDGIVWWTQKNLASAFNVDITCRRGEYLDAPLPDDCFVTSWWAAEHFTPFKWYRESANYANGSFNDDGTYCENPPVECGPLGFKMSKAYHGEDTGWSDDMAAYPPNGDEPFMLNCDPEPLVGEECASNTSIFILHPDTFDFTTMQSAIGDDGTVTIAADNVELTTGVETAWVGFDVPIDRAISAVLFDVEFTSVDPDAEGYATEYWVGAQLSGTDERFADEDTPSTSSFLFFETIPPGERVISFRLDANGGPTSSVKLSNLRIGMFIDGDVNGDCVLSVDDFCAWVTNPFDLDGNGVIDDQDQTLLAMALGVSEADENNNGIPDVCDCIGDLDGNNDVGVKDLLILLGAWGPCPPKGGCPADFDGSGDVGVKDLLMLLGNWGVCP